MHTQAHTHTHTHARLAQAPIDTLTDTYLHTQVAHSARSQVPEEELLVSATVATSFLLETPGQQRAPEAPSLQAQSRREGEHVVTTHLPKPGPLCSPAWEEATAPGGHLITESSGPCLVSLVLAQGMSWGATGQ